MNAQPALRVQGVRKTFTSSGLRFWRGSRNVQVVQALKNISFEVFPGQVTALLGPNGAGKTTLINILCDLIRADSGTVSVAGLPLPKRAREIQRRIGVVTTNDRNFFWRLTGRENLLFFGALQDIPPVALRARSRELLSWFGLEAHADRLFRTYSTGMKKRLALARALLHDPEILFMDEATSGLDAVAMEDLMELVLSTFVAQGKCVLWATHRMEEVQTLCDQVVVLMEGEIRFDGQLQEFMQFQTNNADYLVEVEGLSESTTRVHSLLEAMDATLERQPQGFRILLRGTESAETLARLLKGLIDLGVGITRVERRGLTLKELYRQLSPAGVDPLSASEVPTDAPDGPFG